MFLYSKRKKFYETLKNITFTKDTIHNSCETLSSAIETWEQTKTDDQAKQKSKSKPYLDEIKNCSSSIMLLGINPVDDLSHHISKLLIQNLTNLKEALLNASNAKFGFWTFGAVLDNSKIKNELKRISQEIDDLLQEIDEQTYTLIQNSTNWSPSQMAANRKLLIGLPNSANYCFLNSAIQQLYKMKDFRTKVLGAKVDKSDEQHKELFALQQIFKMLQGKLKISDQELNKLRKDLGYKGTQEDSVEHMTRIKEAVENQLEIIKKGNSTNILEIGVQSNKTVAELIQKAYSDTYSDKLPVYLVLEQKKFMIHVHRNDKNAKIENILEPLDLSNIDLVKNQLINVYNSHQDEDARNIADLKFELVGATIHYGSKTGVGHYYVYQKNGGVWRKKNDSEVSNVTIADVLEDSGKNSTLLVYKLKN